MPRVWRSTPRARHTVKAAAALRRSSPSPTPRWCWAKCALASSASTNAQVRLRVDVAVYGLKLGVNKYSIALVAAASWRFTGQHSTLQCCARLSTTPCSAGVRVPVSSLFSKEFPSNFLTHLLTPSPPLLCLFLSTCLISCLGMNAYVDVRTLQHQVRRIQTTGTVCRRQTLSSSASSPDG